MLLLAFLYGMGTNNTPLVVFAILIWLWDTDK